MKRLVIYYSFDGNTEFIAKIISETINADLLKLEPLEEPLTHGFMKFFWGGRQVVTKKKPQLKPFDKNPHDYDVLVIGTPVWAWSYAPALATFLDTVSLKNKRIALYCCHMGGRGNTLQKMKEKLSGNEIIGEINFVEPLNRNKKKNAEKARRWGQNLCERF